jgi:hypothetical protein
MTPTGWRVQYDRMRRWHTRIRSAATVDDLYVDSVYAFFIFCFHLKDWLASDLSVSRQVAGAAELLINTDYAMQLCADLANGLKHVSVTRRPRLSGPVVLSTGVPSPEVSSNVDDYLGVLPTIRAADGSVIAHAPEIADLCVDRWNTFLRQHGLLS